MRVAIYFTPPPEAPLTKAAGLWLGRDAFTGTATRPPDPVIDPLVAEPARYGFHATLRAPFRLRDGATLADAEAALDGLASRTAAFVVPRLRLAQLGRFFALVPADPSPALSLLEGEVLDAFEALRAPLTEAERARRRPETLDERQRDNLDRWGYPHVRDDFRFHMTLTGPVGAEAAPAIENRLRERFGAFEAAPLAIERLAIFVEDAPGTPFRVSGTAPLRG